jgi:predicted glycoside hydrolase/deacetylase ChbG (UPF0249 family)
MSIGVFFFMRHLIINGDDLGLCSGVNKAVFDLCDAGIITSASLLVDGRATQEALLTLRQDFPEVSLGLHLDFGEPPFKIDDLVDRMERQWRKFYQLTEVAPTHVDIHKYPGVSLQVSRFLPVKVPIRNVGWINYIGKFQSENGEDGVSLANLIKILKRVKKGVYELACDPGYEPLGIDGENLDSCGLRERALKTLLDERVKMVLGLRNIQLISYLDLLKKNKFKIHALERFYGQAAIILVVHFFYLTPVHV